MATYLVTGATGKQGGATAKHLLAAGAKVRAVVRDPTKEAAQALARQGVELFQGDNDSFDVFREAAKGCKGLFVVPLVFDQEAQVRQVRGIVQASKEAGTIEVIVVPTAFFTGSRDYWKDQPDELVSYFESKAAVEDVVRTSGVKAYTILRPAWFHSNYVGSFAVSQSPGLKEKGELWHSLDEGVTMSHIDVDDIGKFGAAALLHPEKFNGHEIELGNENLTPEEAAEALQRVSGREIKARRRTPEQQAAAVNIGTSKFQLWMNQKQLKIDGHALGKQYGISMTTFEEYLRREKNLVLATLSA